MTAVLGRRFSVLWRRIDLVWVVSISLSLAFNFVAVFGYAYTLGNGSWSNPLVCPRQCETPRLPVALTIEEARKKLPLPPPPEIKAEKLPPRRETAPAAETAEPPSQPAAMSPIVIPPREEQPEVPAVEVPPPEVLSPIYVQEPPEEESAPSESSKEGISLEAPPIAAPLPRGYVPWAQRIDEASAASAFTGLTRPGAHVALGATGSGLGTAATESGAHQPGPEGLAFPTGEPNAPAPPPPASIQQERQPEESSPPPVESAPPVEMSPPLEPEKQLEEPLLPAVEPPPEPEKAKGPTKPPKLIHRVDPSYPPAGKQLGIEGVVLVRILVTAAGTVGDVSIVDSSGHDMLDEAAVKAVREWKFSPPLEDGVPTDWHIRAKIHFRIVD